MHPGPREPCTAFDRTRRLASLLTLMLVPAALAAQQTGRIVGRIVESGQGAPIAGAQVQITGTDIHTVSAIDGRYTLQNVPVGPVSITARMLGYAPKTVTGLVVTVEGRGRAEHLAGDVDGAAGGSGGHRRGGEGLAQLRARHPEELRSASSTRSAPSRSRSHPTATPAQAVQRVSGVSVEDGKYVIVRGLGERYTTTALNGATIPSAETDRKVVPLDLFPTNLLEGITTSKTFTPDQPGDFSGARVDLKTKEFPAGRQINIGVSAGFNTAVTGQDIAEGADRERRLVRQRRRTRAAPGRRGRGRRPQRRSTRRSSTPSSARSGMSGARTTAPATAPAASTPPSAARTRSSSHMFGYLASFSYGIRAGDQVRPDEGHDQAWRRGVRYRAAAQPVQRQSSIGSVLWGGLLNFSTRIGSSSKFDFNNTYTRGADNSVEDLGGFNEEFATNFVFSRLTYIQRSVRTNQLVGNHLIGPRNYVTWQVATSGITRDEPDRSDIGYLARTGTDGQLEPVPVVRPDPLRHPHLEHAQPVQLGPGRQLAAQLRLAQPSLEREGRRLPGAPPAATWTSGPTTS